MSLRVFLFGSVRASHDGSSHEIRMTRAVQGLLAYLMLHRRRVHPREVLAGVFWGELNEKRARGCLNTALWRLRVALEPPWVARGDYLHANPAGNVGFNLMSDHWLDVAVFEEEVTRVVAKPIQTMDEEDARQLEAALRLHTGELLEGFYADWALGERERLRLLHLKSLVHLMRYNGHLGAFEEALAWARRVLTLDPLREEIHREAMRLYAANGQRSLAVEQYKACCRVLDEELGIPPMEETRLLFSQIVNGAATPLELQLPKTTPGEGIGRGVALDRALEELHLAMRCAEKVHKELQLAIQHLEKLTRPPCSSQAAGSLTTLNSRS